MELHIITCMRATSIYIVIILYCHNSSICINVKVLLLQLYATLSMGDMVYGFGQLVNDM
jgi:hypothetical protein